MWTTAKTPANCGNPIATARLAAGAGVAIATRLHGTERRRRAKPLWRQVTGRLDRLRRRLRLTALARALDLNRRRNRRKSQRAEHAVGQAGNEQRQADEILVHETFPRNADPSRHRKTPVRLVRRPTLHPRERRQKTCVTTATKKCSYGPPRGTPPRSPNRLASTSRGQIHRTTRRRPLRSSCRCIRR